MTSRSPLRLSCISLGLLTLSGCGQGHVPLFFKAGVFDARAERSAAAAEPSPRRYVLRLSLTASGDNPVLPANSVQCRVNALACQPAGPILDQRSLDHLKSSIEQSLRARTWLGTLVGLDKEADYVLHLDYAIEPSYDFEWSGVDDSRSIHAGVFNVRCAAQARAVTRAGEQILRAGVRSAGGARLRGQGSEAAAHAALATAFKAVHSRITRVLDSHLAPRLQRLSEARMRTGKVLSLVIWPIVLQGPVPEALGQNAELILRSAAVDLSEIDVVSQADQAQVIGSVLETYRECYDQKCQIEIGSLLSASHMLVTKAYRTEQGCLLSLGIIDLTRQVVAASHVVSGECASGPFLRNLESGAKTVLGRLVARGKGGER